jgi:hypothetical protein
MRAISAALCASLQMTADYLAWPLGVFAPESEAAQGLQGRGGARLIGHHPGRRRTAHDDAGRFRLDQGQHADRVEVSEDAGGAGLQGAGTKVAEPRGTFFNFCI